MTTRSRIRLLLAVSALALAGAACGGGGTASVSTTASRLPSPTLSAPTPAPSPTCALQGAKLEIVAQKDAGGHPAFDKDCLAAPANAPFTIRFDNRDADTHNIDILDQPGGTPFFTGAIITGPKVVTYSVKPIEAGTYYFRCDIHPLLMNGAFIVGG